MNEEKNGDAQMKGKMNGKILHMTPAAVSALQEILINPDMNPSAKVAAIGIILDRALGKPEENIRIESSEADFEEAQRRLEAIFAMVDNEKE